MTVISTVLGSSYGIHPRQRYDLFVPERREPPVLVVCLGGSWQGGRHEDQRSLALALAEQGYAAACLGHRLLGDGARHGQDICDDVRAALTKAVEEAAIHGAAPRSVILLGLGDSSLVALAVASQCHGYIPAVRAVVACGVHPTLETWDGCPTATIKLHEQFAGGHKQHFDPMHLDAHRFPPVLLVHGDSDTEVPARLVTKLHMRLVEAGESSTLAILAGLGHQILNHPHDRAGKLALERILPFLAEHAREPGGDERLFAGSRA
jgi:acetyl esterase/lipase